MSNHPYMGVKMGKIKFSKTNFSNIQAIKLDENFFNKVFNMSLPIVSINDKYELGAINTSGEKYFLIEEVHGDQDLDFEYDKIDIDDYLCINKTNNQIFAMNKEDFETKLGLFFLREELQ